MIDTKTYGNLLSTVTKVPGDLGDPISTVTSLRADAQFSVLRVHCPEVNPKAKDIANCRFTMQPTRKRLRLFSHNCLCKSTQSARSSRRVMWRVWILSREFGESRCDWAIEFLTRVQCAQDRSSSGLWWPSVSKCSIVTIRRTNWDLSVVEIGK